MKEYLFERLRHVVPGAKVVDVFSGTGTIGLEALSRDAASVVFIERDHKAFDLLKKNVKKIGVEEETVCWRTDVLRTSFVPKGVSKCLPYDIIFFDPPYPMVPGLKAGDPLYKSLERLARENVSSPNCLLTFRTERRTEFQLPPVWKLEDEMSVSSSTMFFYRKSAGTTDENLDETVNKPEEEQA